MRTSFGSRIALRTKSISFSKAEDENGEVFHDTFSNEPTETEVNTIATQRLALLAEKEAAEE